MNAHVTIPADRSLLPRSLLPRRPVTPATIHNGEVSLTEYPPMAPVMPIKRYRFAVGAKVRFHEHQAVVLSRSSTMRQQQLFLIRILTGDYGDRPIRLVGSESLARYQEVSDPAA